VTRHTIVPAVPNPRLTVMAMFGATLLSMPAASRAQMVQDRISGEAYADWGKDATGLGHHASAGVVCVLHFPKCAGRTGLVGFLDPDRGHNGKDHFFPKDNPLPPGASISRVDFKAFWPDASITHTDRGGVGSGGSYGSSMSQQGKPPFVSVHWENACEASTGGNDWSNLPVTYQISFIVSHPKDVALKNAVDASLPFSDVCSGTDIPRKTPPQPTPTAATGGVSGSYKFNCTAVSVCSATILFSGNTTAATGSGITKFSIPETSSNLIGPSSIQFSAAGLRFGPWTIIATPKGACPSCGVVTCQTYISANSSPMVVLDTTLDVSDCKRS
jgi:hypothetical protein